ncbi:hypothetical protein FS837_005101 [Tulasnella sp. UAMH 9824]|nr:hypothetical protein FS837_005101 [Tulasnella sp. UAMH 9824]
MSSNAAARYFMHLHNLAQRNSWSVTRETYARNPAANEEWMAEITVNGHVFIDGPRARKQQAVDAAALKALIALGVDTETLRD